MKTRDDDLQDFVQRIALSRRAQVVDVGFRVVRYSLIEQIGFSLQQDHVHEVK